MAQATLNHPFAKSMDIAVELAASAPGYGDAPAQMRQLRLAKKQAALALCLADCGGVLGVMEAAAALSEFADACVHAALMSAMRQFDTTSADKEVCAGLSVLAMGKHGARELNYSSDIDLIVLFDPQIMTARFGDRGAKNAVTATKTMVALLSQQTPDGYVFRTDLRLRPDPGVTAAAISIDAAEHYYEAHGQNWERAAFIKARTIAGDFGVGERFLQTLKPFIWRRYLDFAAIEDIQSIKKQIHSTKGHGDIAFWGHDIKLGRGGIREIEFYAQTQQLILGGKNPDLRSQTTLEALDQLVIAGHVEAQAAQELKNAYVYLRFVEHRVQMVADEQTHKIPRGEENAERLRCFVGADSLDAFEAELTATLSRVHDRFEKLFASPDPKTEIGALIFTGVENDPQTIETLTELGFQRAEDISTIIRAWHTGRLRALRTPRAREQLTKLTPQLIQALGAANAPDDAFFAFDDFLAQLPSGVQIFALFTNNPEILDVLIKLLVTSPVLSRQLPRRHNFLEQFVDTAWVRPPSSDDFDEIVASATHDAHDLEGALNIVRRRVGELRFLIGVQIISGILAPNEGGRLFTALAEASIAAIFPAVARDMQARHGALETEICVLAFGRFGAKEMSFSSDLDLVFVYDGAPDAMSDGKKPIGAGEYCAKLVRRLVTALSVPTQEGALYEIDMQLRPSGRAGPAAVTFAAFSKYYADEAWTWEFMALSRARVVFSQSLSRSLSAAPTTVSELHQKIDTKITEILTAPRTALHIRSDIVDMREKLLAQKPAKGPFDLKNAHGGLTDIAFIIQALGLVHGAEIGRLPAQIPAALDVLRVKGVLSAKEAKLLLKAHTTFEVILLTGRIARTDFVSADAPGAALTKILAANLNQASLTDIMRSVDDLRAGVRNIFDASVGSIAPAAPAKKE